MRTRSYCGFKTDEEFRESLGDDTKARHIGCHGGVQKGFDLFISDKTVESTTNPKDLFGSKKPPLSLVPPSVILHLAQAFKEGAAKYGPYNWREKKVQTMIYIDAILRHTMAFLDGEDLDPDSKTGKHHLDGVLASAAVLIDAMETGNLIDNRPLKGPASRLINEFTEK